MRTTIIIIALFFRVLCFAQHDGFISLDTAKFMVGNDAQWSTPDYNDSAWKLIKTGDVWQSQGYQDYHGYAWYRIYVIIPSSLKNKAVWKDSLRLFLAHINDADETYLNGTLIGKTGSFPDDKDGYVSKWPAVRDYHLPATHAAIRWDAENVIAIKVFDGGGTGGIFMGNPYIDMLEKTDGLSISLSHDSIRYQKQNTFLPLSIANHFNTLFDGDCKVVIRNVASNKVIAQQHIPLHLGPLEQKVISFAVPNQPSITLSYLVMQKGSNLTLSRTELIPYILTPAPVSQPHINSASVVGIHPNTPFFFKIAATGAKPLQYYVSGLPAGLHFDNKTGIITGTLPDAGQCSLLVTVTNTKGKATQNLVIKAGNELALTPPMGWNSWNCWGTAVSEEKVKSSAQAMIDKGLPDYGWSYINIDDGWQQPKRANDSSVIPNDKFGNMKGLGDWLHNKGLKFGIYSSPGPLTCGGYLGSYRNEQKDAQTYAGWGIDYLKYDWCSYDNVVRSDTTLPAYQKPFSLMDSCLATTGRSIVYNLCQYGMKDVWAWGREVHAQSWRTTEDIEDTWESLSRIGFAQAPLYPFAAPGHWNDPDMMIVGQVGWGENLHPSRLTPDEQYTHVSLWCMLSAPLLIGCDISRLDAFTLNLLTNSEVLAIDQDVLGKQAQRIITNDSIQVWIKELHDGAKAVAIFNTSLAYRSKNITWKELGLNAQLSVRDVWRQKEIGVIKNRFTVVLPPHGVRLIVVK